MSCILVLDDDHAIIDLYRLLLTDEGYDVVVSRPMMDPLLAVEHSAPDVIIIDYMFGAEPYGWQLVQQLKLHPSTAHIAVVVCTAAPQVLHEHAATVAHLGIELVVKPFMIEDFLEAVKRASAYYEPSPT